MIVPTLRPRMIRCIAATVSLVVSKRAGFPIFSVVAKASFTKELLISISR